MSDPQSTTGRSEIPLGPFAGDVTAAAFESSADGNTPSAIIAKIIAEVIMNRAQGEQISNEQVIASHPELMPDLREELLAAGEIHKAIILHQKQSTSEFPINTSSEGSTSRREDVENLQNAIDPHKGLRLQGYLIEREISSGGQATVFKAVQERTGRAVAIKLMHGGPFMGARSRTRFERESTILARLNHPNIVTILDRGRTTDGSFFLVMDYIDGPNLDGYVRDLDKDTAVIVRLFVKIANAIDDAHQNGIVHRDLKPMNILVDSRGEPHILDFGMARLMHDEVGNREIDLKALTRTGQVLGTLPWTSPEQVSDSPGVVDARSDVYALGVMLFTSLTGQFPYPIDGNLWAITDHIANTSPASPSRLAQQHGIKVPGFLEDVILKALSKSPRKRYESAGLLAGDLEASLAGKPRSLSRFVLRRLSKIVLFGLLVSLTMVSFEKFPAAKAQPSFVNSIGMRLVRISPDEARLITLPNDPSEIDYRQAPTGLGLKAFYMSATLVTEVEFYDVTGHYPSNLKGTDFPVHNVSWDDANTFCSMLSERDKRKYRLPTAAEWKLAWRIGGLSTLSQNNLDATAWYAGNSGSHLHAVAQKTPDRSGLYDMVGNMRQWCSLSEFPLSSSKIAAEIQRKSAEPVEGTDFLASGAACLLPSELELSPMTSKPMIGFRVVCESIDPN